MAGPSGDSRTGVNVYMVLVGIVMVAFFAWVVAQMVGARHHSGGLYLITRVGIGFAAAALGVALGFVTLRWRRGGRG